MTKALATTEQTAPVSDAAALMATITRAATDASVDAEKMERLWALYEKMDARRAERDFNIALKKAQQAMPAVFKNQKADKNKYATLEAVNDVVVPISTENGFAMSFGNEDSPMDKHYRIVCFLSHDGGHTRKYHADVPSDQSGSKNVTQGFGSTISYGRRYLTLMMFNVSTTDDNDGAGGTHGPSGAISIEQRDTLAKIIEDNGFAIDVFLKWAGVETLADIPAASYQKAFNALMGKVQAKRNQSK